MSYEEELKFCLESKIPKTVTTGRGTVMVLTGWCFHTSQEISRLDILTGTFEHKVLQSKLIRHDVGRHHPEYKFSSRSGFLALIPISSDIAGETELTLQATLNDRSQIRKRLAKIEIHEKAVETRLRSSSIGGAFSSKPNCSTGDDPLVGIAMATYNPQIDLFRGQIESLIAQNHRNWLCVISDDGSDAITRAEMQKIIEQDKRFAFSVAPKHLGFYQNFERSLMLIPEEAAFVALSDQDDFWRPDKLQTLLASFEPETALAYSDMKIVDKNGKTISETFWSHRKNNYTDLAAMLMVNSVTGASSIFRRELLEYALPFPTGLGNLHHDHWIACVALAVGKLSWVDRPLHNYVQHGDNVTGFGESPGKPPLKTIYLNFRYLSAEEGVAEAKRVYFDQVVKLSAMAKVLRMRGGKKMKWQKLSALHRMERLGDSFFSGLWMVFQGLKRRHVMSTTNGAEFFILMGIVWGLLVKLRSRMSASRLGKFGLRFCPRLVKEIE